jgi:two-component system, sensor histidine kinase and response regulator
MITMKKLCIAVLLLTITPGKIPAQTKAIDSIKYLISNSKADTSKIILINKIAILEMDINPKSALEYSSQALSLSEKLGWKNGQAETRNNMGVIYTRLGDPGAALKNYQEALFLNRQLENKSAEAKNIANIGLAYGDLAEYDKSLEYSKQALEMYRNQGNKTGEARCLTNLGYVYSKLSDIPKALDYDQQALKINREINNLKSVALNLGNIGLVYRDAGKTDQAMKYFLEAIEISKKTGNRYNEAMNLTNIGMMNTEYHNYTAALDYLNKALLIHQELGSKRFEAVTLGNIAAAYYKMNDYDKSIEYYEKALKLGKEVGDRERIGELLVNAGGVLLSKNKIQNGIAYENQAIAISKEIKAPAIEENAWLNLYQLYEKSGRPAEALDAYKKYIDLKDKLQNVDKEKEFTRKEMQYAFDIKEAQNKAVQEKKDLQTRTTIETRSFERNIFLAGMALAAIIAVFMIVISRRLNKLNKQLVAEKEKSDQLSNLKDKLFSIISHDLRSPLINISSVLELIRNDDLPEDSKQKSLELLDNTVQQNLQMLDNLLHWASSQINGVAINKRDVNIDNLIDENIQMIKGSALKKNIQLSVDYDPGMKGYADLSMMKIILRNLLSNAIKFTPEGGEIEITTRHVDQQVEITVKDTGVGMEKDFVNGLFTTAIGQTKPGTNNENGFGLGLRLCKEFVEKNEGQFVIESVPGSGSSFSFTIPRGV